jgi:hypothetical protein
MPADVSDAFGGPRQVQQGDQGRRMPLAATPADRACLVLQIELGAVTRSHALVTKGTRVIAAGSADLNAQCLHGRLTESESASRQSGTLLLEYLRRSAALGQHSYFLGSDGCIWRRSGTVPLVAQAVLIGGISKEAEVLRKPATFSRAAILSGFADWTDDIRPGLVMLGLSLCVELEQFRCLRADLRFREDCVHTTVTIARKSSRAATCLMKLKIASATSAKCPLRARRREKILALRVAAGYKL